jgi:hypothetical protein
MFVLAYAVAVAAWGVSLNGGVDPSGRPAGSDFVTFYAAGGLALDGQAAAAYDEPTITGAEKDAVPGSDWVFLWHYPPSFQLIVAPLAALPYGAALAVWLLLSGGLYLLMVRKLSGHPSALLVGLAFPAVFINAMHGQNGFLNAALLGGGLLLLDRRPWLAGLLIGLLAYKPHFGVLLPFLLMAQGRWRTFASAAVTSISLSAAAWLALGPEPWLAFVRNFGVVSQVLESRALPWEKIPSVFVTVAGLGAPLPVAYAVHAAVALALAGLTVDAWRRPGSQALKVALAIPAVLAVSPYCFDYDLVLLAIPIGLMAEHARSRPLPAGGKALLVLAFLTPVLFTPFAKLTGVQLMPVPILLLFGLIWATLARERGAEDARPAVLPVATQA